ncbi:MAG TPA: MFS transporter, partial [Candidatus Sulfotelmatobacter sp.]|nr:MFS transporter [Candidatus Sulfotelmatobacter sp.]
MSASISSDPQFLDGIYRKVSLRLLPFLTLCYMLAFLDRINIGFAKLQMQSNLGLSDAVYGLGAGIFFIGYVLFEIPSNLLLPRIGARRTIARIMVLWGLVSASMMFVHDARSFYALRFLLGVFEAGFAPGMILYLTYWYPPARMARTMAIVMAAGPIGGIVGGPVSSWAMTALAGAHGLAGWQWMFLVEGLPCTALGVVAWYFLTNRIDDAHWLTSSEKATLNNELAASPEVSGAHRALLKAVADPRVLGIAFSNFCVICGIYTVSFWLPTIIKAAGISGTLEIGMWSTVPYIASLVAMYAVSRSSDRRSERRLHSAICSVVAAATLLVATTHTSSLLVSIGSIAIATAMIWASYTVLWAIPADYLKGASAPGGIAFINVVGVLGGFFSPVIIGTVKSATGSLQ